jgi:apolipoprotein N-acyltransferase
MLRNLTLALTGGFLAAMSFPNPVFISLHWPGGFLAFICLVPLLAIREESGPAWKYWRWGIPFGLVYFGLATLWMSAMPAMRPFAPGVWLLLTAYLACYPAAFLAGYRYLLSRGVPAWSAAAPWWLVLEFLRNYLFTGFPWVALGYAHHRFWPLLALAPVAGIWGLSWVTVLANSGLHAALARWLPAGAGQERVLQVQTESLRGESRRRLLILAVLLLALTAGAIYERRQLLAQPGQNELTIAAMQGNIDQNQPWTPAYQKQTLDRYYDLLSQASAQGASLAVWPESAFPGIFNWDLTAAGEVKSWSQRLHIAQAVGADTLEQYGRKEFRYFNSLVLVDGEGEVRGVTSKIHLVPFGEYIPLRNLLVGFLRKIVSRYGAGDFSPGTARHPLRWQAAGQPAAFGSLICFESLFPQYAADLARQGSEFLVVITLDTWFGHTAAPAQHAMFSALRAAENGRYLIRAAATGISCVYDPQGRLLGEVALDQAGLTTRRIAGRSQLTMFTRFGPWLVWLCLAGLVWDFGLRKNVRKKDRAV